MRAYAINSKGVAYGNSSSFKTNTLPDVTTLPITDVINSSVSFNGNITFAGDPAYTEKGFVYGTMQNPTINNTKVVVSGSGTGNFSASVGNLTGATTYYVRAYATSTTRTAYGNTISFRIPIVYVAGTANFRSILWTNGVQSTLSTGGRANSVFVSGNDVYVAGRASNYYGAIWKNRNIYNSFINYDLQSIFVSGNDVYVVGNDDNNEGSANVWKNDNATSLTFGTAISKGRANSVFVSGNDVYVAGYIKGSQLVPTVWKNGVATTLSNRNSYDNNAASVFVSGSDVYVAGHGGNSGGIVGVVAKIWKNGVATNLSDGTNNAYAYAYSVFVSGNDVYVAGSGYIGGSPSVAKIWKNGVATNLTDGTNSATAYSVFVLGNDVYVAGQDGSQAILWVNGVATDLGTGEAKSVYVKE
ncbi:hypothetical protein FACS189413_13980 [Bacteroidia bacterium]|nr:hypothetical protein FACS189413_13980 [Bacteroidia bacterium]